MANGVDEDSDAVLSDVESDEPLPNELKDPAPEDVSPEKFKEILAELDRERQAREAAESSKSELQKQFNRLKALTHEAIKKRDERQKERDEALRENENLSKQLADANTGKDELATQKDEISIQLDEAVRARDSLKAEIDNSAHMLISGIEKISGKVSNFKNFANGGLPKSQKYTGSAAVAYGVIKRTNEIVEELVRQIDAASKSRNEARAQVEQRNYEIAIEVSQLEATISGLKQEVAEKISIVEDLESNMSEKDKKIAEIEKETLEKVSMRENETLELKQLVSEYDGKLRALESKTESHRPLLMGQLNLISSIHNRLYEVIRIADGETFDQSDLSESLFMPQETDIEEIIRASVAGMESIHELTKVVTEKTRNSMEERSRKVKSLDETVGRLVKEKEHIGTLLKSALSKRMVLEETSKTNELFQAAENGLRDAGINFKFSQRLGDDKLKDLHHNADGHDAKEDEIYTLAGALENIVKTSQLEIIELQHSVEEVREEANLFKKQVEAQAKELNQRLQRIEELEEKERIANENVEGLMTDIAAAEEEITRWKAAAEQEAAAGRAVEQEYTSQLSALRQELEEAKQAMNESEKKLRFKEETAAAAMAARDAAEKSLRLADTRATRLRERIEELGRQLEEFESRQDSAGRNRPRYVCWPWQWLGLEFVGAQRSEMEQQGSNEMELSEPLL